MHEIGWSGEFKDKDTGEAVLLPFETVQEILDEKIKGICYDVEATEPPVIFLTNSERLTEIVNRSQRYSDQPPCVYLPNFRYEVAKTKPYKGTRKNPKPFHFWNISAYLLANYDVVVSRGGLEADDMMCLQQTREDNTIICSRDKDLRICPGWHFSWECGGQRAIGPFETDRLGHIFLKKHESINKKTGKITISYEVGGYGLAFFFSQMVTGDTADNIPGLSKQGAVAAYKLLSELTTEEEMYKAVKNLYKEKLGEGAKEMFMEQMQLLWMKQTGAPLYKFKKGAT